MDKYDQKWVRIPAFIAGYGWQAFAITIGQTSYFTCSEASVGPAWHRHEDKHKEQWKREGAFRFIIKYVCYSFQYGYKWNPLEVDARDSEKGGSA